MSIEVASGDSITPDAVQDQGSGGYCCGSGIHVLTAPATVDRRTVTVIEDALTAALEDDQCTAVAIDLDTALPAVATSALCRVLPRRPRDHHRVLTDAAVRHPAVRPARRLGISGRWL